MSELKNGPFFAKLVDSNDLNEKVIDPLAYTTGRELGKFADIIDLEPLHTFGKIRGMPSHVTLEGEELANARKVNYKQVDNSTGFYSPVPLNRNDDSYSGRQLLPGTIVIGRMRPYLNNTIVIDPDFTGTTTIVSDSEWQVFEPKDNLHYFWAMILRTNNVLRQFSITRGQTRPRLHEDDLRQISVPSIPKDKRAEIDEYRRGLFQSLQGIEREITDSARKMDDYLDNDGPLPDF